MIGQRVLKEQVNIWKQENSLPKFLIVQGIEGSGKKTLLAHIAKQFGMPLLYFANKMEGVRELIDVCYNQSRKIMYAIADVDKMSGTAENALLKIAEEPPTNAYIAITSCSDTLLPTIKSRGVTVVMESYTQKDKEEYVDKVLDLDVDDVLREEMELSDTLYDISVFERCDFSRLKKLCENIVEKIKKANTGSALCISQNISVKETDNAQEDKFDLGLFLKVLSKSFYDKYMKTRERLYYNSYAHILNAKKQLQRSFNKSYILDELLLKLQGSCV